METDCDTRLLRNLPLFTPLSSQAMASLQASLRVVPILKRQPLTLVVPPTTHYIIPLTSNLTLHRSADGHFGLRLPRGVLWPIALAADSTAEVRCSTSGTVGLLSSACVNHLMQTDAALRMAMLQAAVASQAHITLELEQYLGNSLTGRVAHTLLALAADQPVIRYSHAELAALLNAQRESISLVLGRFRKAGWIQTRYGRIEIREHAPLHMLATQF